MTRYVARFGAPFALLLACQRLPSNAVTGGGDGGDGSFTGSSSESGSGETGGETSAGEADATDDGNPMLDCDPVMQTGCNAGEKCTVVINSGEVTYTCVADNQSLNPFSACTPELGTGLDGCPAGYACFADETDAGLCVELCLDNSDCDPGLCRQPTTNNAQYCADECSPFEAMCPSPLQCRRASDRFICSFAHTSDTGGQAEPCALANDSGCAEGFVCLPGELVPTCGSGSCCTVLCDTTADTCESPMLCGPLFDAPAPGAETIGACFVPA